jgi:hypothetical protein
MNAKPKRIVPIAEGFKYSDAARGQLRERAKKAADELRSRTSGDKNLRARIDSLVESE